MGNVIFQLRISSSPPFCCIQHDYFGGPGWGKTLGGGTILGADGLSYRPHLLWKWNLYIARWMLKSIRVDTRFLFLLHRAILFYFIFSQSSVIAAKIVLRFEAFTVKSGLFLIFYIFLSNCFQRSRVGISDSHIKGDVFWWSVGMLVGLCPEGLKQAKGCFGFED